MVLVEKGLAIVSPYYVREGTSEALFEDGCDVDGFKEFLNGPPQDEEGEDIITILLIKATIVGSTSTDEEPAKKNITEENIEKMKVVEFNEVLKVRDAAINSNNVVPIERVVNTVIYRPPLMVNMEAFVASNLSVDTSASN